MGTRVGTYIQELRQRRGLSIRQLGSNTGLSPSYLSLVERGKREVSIHALYPLIRFLDGDFAASLRLLAADAGVPEEELSAKSSQSTKEATR